MAVAERGVARERRGRGRYEAAGLGHVVLIVDRIASAGFEIRKNNRGVVRAGDRRQRVGFDGKVPAQRGIAAADEREGPAGPVRGCAEMGRELEVERAGAVGRQAARVGEDVAAGSGVGEFGGEGGRVPGGDDWHVVHGLRSGGIVIEHDELARRQARQAADGGQRIFRPDGRERREDGGLVGPLAHGPVISSGTPWVADLSRKSARLPCVP
jgi:hypothetical protein